MNKNIGEYTKKIIFNFRFFFLLIFVFNVFIVAGYIVS